MKGIAGLVVLYHPEEASVLRNINSYLPFLEELFVIDNSSETKADISKRIAQLPGTVHYLANGRNRGIAAALNQGASLALNKGYSWVLTMDQDSFFEKDDIRAYFAIADDALYNYPDAAVIAPSYENKKNATEDTPAFSEVFSVITSGSLLKLRTWEDAGRFEEKLFIDEVDHEYCYRVYLSGHKIIRLNKVRFCHNLGRQKRAGYMGKINRASRTLHSPQRVYFMVRNYLYVRNKYMNALPALFKRRDAQMLIALKNNILFSGSFFEVLKNILNGYTDYRKGNFSAKI